MRTAIVAILCTLLLPLGCIPQNHTVVALSSDPGSESEKAPPASLEEFLADIAGDGRGLDRLSEDELRELLSFFPDPPEAAPGSDVAAYLREEGFEQVVLLEPFGYQREGRSVDEYQLAYAERNRIFLLEPPLIEGFLPAGDYWAEVGGLFFEIIGPDGEIWRFTIRSDAN